MIFPKTQLRNVQMDSFFIESVKNAPDNKRQNLSQSETFWLYESDVWLHKFCDKATMDTKFAILAKLGYHYAITVFDDERGCDRLQWMEQIHAARGSETALQWFDKFVHEEHCYIIGSFEVHRILNRLDVMYHSKLFPISRYIKRMRDFKKLAHYENLWKQQDFIYFMLKICFAYSKFSTIPTLFGIDKKDLLVLIFMYMEHRQMSYKELKELLDNVYGSRKIGSSLNLLTKLEYVDRVGHPANYNNKQKVHYWMINENGLEIVRQLCLKILQYI